MSTTSAMPITDHSLPLMAALLPADLVIIQGLVGAARIPPTRKISFDNTCEILTTYVLYIVSCKNVIGLSLS